MERSLDELHFLLAMPHLGGNLPGRDRPRIGLPRPISWHSLTPDTPGGSMSPEWGPPGSPIPYTLRGGPERRDVLDSAGLRPQASSVFSNHPDVNSFLPGGEGRGARQKAAGVPSPPQGGQLLLDEAQNWGEGRSSAPRHPQLHHYRPSQARLSVSSGVGSWNLIAGANSGLQFPGTCPPPGLGGGGCMQARPGVWRPGRGLGPLGESGPTCNESEITLFNYTFRGCPVPVR